MNTKVEISVDQIEKTLGELWEKTPNPTRMKACLFNLIVYTKNAERAEYFYRFIRSILEKFPCRIIFIVSSDNHEEHHLKVSVSNDMIGREEKHAPCDQILLQVSGDQREKAPFIVLPLIVPDLPVYLVWGEEPTTNDPLLKQFVEIATRIVFDSEYTGNIQQYSKKILNFIDFNKADIMDMKWAHISRWRDILAAVFDTPEKIAHLYNIKEVKISYAGEAHGNIHHDQTQALLLQAWLGSRMGWKFIAINHKTDTTHIHYQKSEREVNTTLIPVYNEDVPPAALVSITITTTEGFIYEVARLKKYPKVIVHVTTEDACEVPYTMPLPSMLRGLTFLKELFYSQVSEQYRDTLEFLASIDWGTCDD